MLDSLNSDLFEPRFSPQNLPIFAQKALDRCHVLLPDSTHPVGAIIYENRYYAYVKFFQDEEAAKRGGMRLVQKGNEVILTRVRKGLVLWVLEPDAHRVGKILR